MHLISSDLDSRFVIPNRRYFDNACEFANITVVKERKNVIIRSITGKVVLVNEVKIQWHPGFVAAMNLEFGENRRDLVSHTDCCGKRTETGESHMAESLV